MLDHLLVPTRTKLSRTPLAALAAIMLTACGDAEPPEPMPQEAAPPPGVAGQAPTPFQGIPSVVILRPTEGGAPPPADAALMDQLGLAFTPNQLIVRAGQPVEFANSESLAHNVHVRLMANDSSVYVADMDPDARAQILLDAEGGYDVTCDEHPGMRAVIYVTSAPYATFAENDGSFLIPDVPPGSYTAQVWTTSGLSAARPVSVTGPRVELDLTAP